MDIKKVLDSTGGVKPGENQEDNKGKSFGLGWFIGFPGRRIESIRSRHLCRL